MLKKKVDLKTWDKKEHLLIDKIDYNYITEHIIPENNLIIFSKQGKWKERMWFAALDNLNIINIDLDLIYQISFYFQYYKQS